MNTITPELRTKIEFHIQHDDLYYVDYRDELDTENLNIILQKGSTNSDYIDYYDEYESMKSILDDIKNTFDLDDDFINEHGDELQDIIYDKCSNDPLPDLIKNAGEQSIRLTAYSNYEGIRSDYTYSQSGYEYSEGLKDIIDILQLDPQTVKKTLVSKGFKTVGTFPTIKSRLGKEYISYANLATELNNTMSECNLLTFVGLADIRDFIDYNKAKTIITIPKGNSCGLFDNSCGSGSLIECKLLRDFTVDISTLHGEQSKYDSWDISIDSESGYSIDSVYGVTKEFFGKQISAK